MDTVGQIIVFSSRQLSDQRRNREFTRWNRKDLLNYLNSGLKEIAAYRAEAFASTSEFTLQPGSKQTLPDGVTLTGLTNANGVPAGPSDASVFKAFGAYNICPAKVQFVRGVPTYSAKSFAVDEGNVRTFYVSPAVPVGVDSKVTIDIQGKAPEYTFRDWNKPIAMQDKFYNNLVDWIMARAYQMDTESQVSLAQARGLLQGFYSVMGVKYKMDSARNSGFYEGKFGTGDPRAVAL